MSIAEQLAELSGRQFDDIATLRHNIKVLEDEREAAIAAAVQAERDACARLVEAKAKHYKEIEWYPAYGLDAFAAEDECIAAAIRARGNGAGRK